MVTIAEWTEYFGFKRFPFDRPEAGNEEFSRPEFLASCFVEPESFDRILGQADSPVTALVFAERGIGKTATRVMVDYYCKRGFVPAASQTKSRYVLSVPHIHLSHLVAQARREGNDASVRLEHHIAEILRRTVHALTELIASETSIEHSLKDLSPLDRLDLAWLMTRYGTLPATQLAFLQRLGLILPDDPNEVSKIYRAAEETISSHLVTTLFRQHQRRDPLTHLTSLAELMPSLGAACIYVTVDGVDEFAESAGDPHMAYQIVQPLLGSLELMDGTPNLVLKCFLPAALHPLIMEDPRVRKDRGFIMTTIRWQEGELIEILRRRLDAVRTRVDAPRIDDKKPQSGVHSGFDLLCVPELHGTIESELVRYCDGNPRHLFVLCGLMVLAHCSQDSPSQEDAYLLNRYDVDTALSQFQVQMTPYQLKTLGPVHLIDLLGSEESEQLEFKSSLRWDFYRKKVNQDVRQAIGKALAGMLNRHGGVLAVGVNDDGRVVGLDHDIQTLNKKNLDGFQLELNHIVENFLGLGSRQHLQVRFESHEDKTVCLITIQPSPNPIYFHAGDQREFYVRFGNSTRKLDVSAALDYIHNHWEQLWQLRE